MNHIQASQYAIAAAMESPCQSKRGGVIWSRGCVVSVGFNHQPYPCVCDGSDACKSVCGRTAVHAEQQALLEAYEPVAGASMLHVQVAGGLAVPSGQPSCLECSKLILEAGIAWMWLLHEDGWKRYSAAKFHELTIANVLGQRWMPKEACTEALSK